MIEASTGALTERTKWSYRWPVSLSVRVCGFFNHFIFAGGLSGDPLNV